MFRTLAVPVYRVCIQLYLPPNVSATVSFCGWNDECYLNCTRAVRGKLRTKERTLKKISSSAPQIINNINSSPFRDRYGANISYNTWPVRDTVRGGQRPTIGAQSIWANHTDQERYKFRELLHASYRIVFLHNTRSYSYAPLKHRYDQVIQSVRQNLKILVISTHIP